jgi:hypothetical protein
MHRNNSRKELIVNNRIILISIISLLALLALPLTGCDPDSGRTLVLHVDTPKNDTTVATSTITITGHLGGTESKGATVSVNGADVTVKDLKFSTDVTLNEGKNVITLVARSGQAAPEERVTVTYVPAKK